MTLPRSFPAVTNRAVFAIAFACAIFFVFSTLASAAHIKIDFEKG